MLMLTTRPALHQAAGSETAARRLAYRRLAATILGMDVHSLTGHLQAQRIGDAAKTVPMDLDTLASPLCTATALRGRC
jgi:hypothetical protein